MRLLFAPSYSSWPPSVSGELLFEFDAHETAAYLRHRIIFLEAERSSHNAILREQQACIDRLHRIADALARVAATPGTENLQDVVTGGNDIYDLFQEIIPAGFGVCSCSICQDVYPVSICKTEEWGRSKRVCCPEGHPLFYLERVL